jgi:hypothetical protein
LKFAKPSGMPMTVRQSRMPVISWLSASHQPHNRNHKMFPSAEATPASGRLTTVRPNGHSANMPIRSEAIPNGIVMIKTKQISAAVV